MFRLSQMEYIFHYDFGLSGLVFEDEYDSNLRSTVFVVLLVIMIASPIIWTTYNFIVNRSRPERKKAQLKQLRMQDLTGEQIFAIYFLHSLSQVKIAIPWKLESNLHFLELYWEQKSQTPILQDKRWTKYWRNFCRILIIFFLLAALSLHFLK
jgi:hypothetical protein